MIIIIIVLILINIFILYKFLEIEKKINKEKNKRLFFEKEVIKLKETNSELTYAVNELFYKEL